MDRFSFLRQNPILIMAQQGQKIDLNDMNINQVVQVKKQLDNVSFCTKIVFG